jgi:hypothetical protein
MTDSGDLVATWNILIADGKHKIEFEHGTTSGKRIIRVDGKVKKLRIFSYHLYFIRFNC